MNKQPPTFSDGELARWLGKRGRYGDTLVAHISPSEARMLKEHGGSGTRNPVTGLLEYFGAEGGAGSHGKSTADKGGGNSSGSGKDDGSGASYQGGGTYGDSFSKNGTSITRTKRNVDPNDGMTRDQADALIGMGPFSTLNGPTITRTKRNGQRTGANNDTTAMSMVVGPAYGLTPDQIGTATSAYRDAITDAYDDGLGGLLGFLSPFHERVDFDKIAKEAASLANGAPATASMENAHWGFDVPGAIAGLAGLATGIPFGTALSRIKDIAGLMGYQGFDPNPGMGFGLGEVDLGNDVFGGGTSGATGTTSTGTSVAQGPGVGQGVGVGNTLGHNGVGGAQNAGGGLVAVSDPSNAGSTAPPLPVPTGLLQYLAQNQPYLPGHTSMTRFGAGAVPPFDYYRPIA
jgi:hypothetical protein